MAIKFERTVLNGNMDAFWRREVEMLPAGFKPLQEFPVGEVIQRGAFVYADVDKLEAAIVKVGVVLKGGTTTAPRVSKRNCFVPGDEVVKVGKEDLVVTVKSVDRSNPEYDVVTFSAAITTLKEGDFVQEGYTDSNSKTLPKYKANAVLGADLEIRKSGLPTIDAAYGGVLLKSVCAKFPSSWLVDGGFCLATNHNIKIVNQ